MQQRPPPSSYRGPNNEHCVIDITQQHLQEKHCPRKMLEDSTHLTICIPRSICIRRNKGKWVHVIPVVVFLCLFILWWFSYPVNLEIKDGRIVAIHRIEDMPLSINDTHVELTILASASSPIASVPQNFTWNNLTEAHPVSGPD